MENYFIKKPVTIAYTPDSSLKGIQNIELIYDENEMELLIDGIEFDYDEEKVKIYYSDFPNLLKFLQAIYIDLQNQFPKDFPNQTLRNE